MIAIDTLIYNSVAVVVYAIADFRFWRSLRKDNPCSIQEKQRKNGQKRQHSNFNPKYFCYFFHKIKIYLLKLSAYMRIDLAWCFEEYRSKEGGRQFFEEKRPRWLNGKPKSGSHRLVSTLAAGEGFGPS
ncbi:MAG: hypothetical protein U1A28_05160 [Patescibacteria group bacterium]|nr:hypothetical protein [Patescibacteria group bacterium]